MRSLALAFFATALSLTACGGREGSSSDSGSSAKSADAVPPAAVTSEAAAPRIDVAPGTAVPITGAIIEVKMIGDTKGYRFEPQHVAARVGDGVKFVVISGGPHEIAFDLDAIPAESRTQLQINMPNSENGRSPLLTASQETWTVSLGGLKPGRYPFVSTPRLPQGMKGEIELQ